LSPRRDRRHSLVFLLTYCFFINIQGSKDGLPSLFSPGLAFNLEKQIGDPPTSRKWLSCNLHMSAALGWVGAISAALATPVRLRIVGKLLVPPIRSQLFLGHFVFFNSRHEYLSRVR
jgi:hypothetical protein